MLAEAGLSLDNGQLTPASQARVRADGSLKLGAGKGARRAGLTGSIHKMGAAAQGGAHGGEAGARGAGECTHPQLQEVASTAV